MRPSVDSRTLRWSAKPKKRIEMGTTLRNYDGSITTTPQRLVYPTTVAEIQAVLKDKAGYPSPVRAMGSHHSLTPCAASDGTIVCPA